MHLNVLLVCKGVSVCVILQKCLIDGIRIDGVSCIRVVDMSDD